LRGHKSVLHLFRCAMKKASGKWPRGPSRASLREMPEVNLDKVNVRRNPYALRIAAEGISVHVGRGRPRKGSPHFPERERPVEFAEIRGLRLAWNKDGTFAARSRRRTVSLDSCVSLISLVAFGSFDAYTSFDWRRTPCSR